MATAPAAVFVEPFTRPVTSVAHAVRVTIASLLVATAIAMASLQVFSWAYGVENRLIGGVPQVPPTGAAADRLVLEQQAVGLSCRVKPALTDRVVFQYGAGEAAAVLTLRHAVAAHRAGVGSIQRYCV